MGQQLRELGLIPDLILSSTALRAATTATLVAEACGFDGDLHETAELYLASPGTIVEILGRLGDGCSRAMVVAHNPGLEELVEHCRTKIAGYKVPRELHLVDEVVRSPSGKADYRWAKSIATGQNTAT